LKQNIIDELSNKKVLILGFGREGRSTYKFIKENNVDCVIGIADKNGIEDKTIKVNDNVSIYTGDNYLDSMYEYDLVIKSPGISFKGKNYDDISYKITSQTELFLKYASKKTIGITGTKGKSTTASLTYDILKKKYNVMLVGNIGIPVFEAINSYESIDLFVYELSSHQLEHVRYSPHISVVLNMFEEHLDHYNSYEDYKEAKRNIFKNQHADDYYILNTSMEDIILSKDYVLNQNVIKIVDVNISFETKLVGKHNRYNIAVASTIAKLLKVNEQDIADAVKEFEGLPHRLEYVGKYKDIHFIDDSIATIPEAVISAIESIDNVSTIILGGMDRGIDYSKLIEYINNNTTLDNIILMNDSGKKIYDGLNKNSRNHNIFLVKNLEEAVIYSYKYTKKDKFCILSPAAASYGIFKNFEERGDKFKEYVKQYSS